MSASSRSSSGTEPVTDWRYAGVFQISSTTWSSLASLERGHIAHEQLVDEQVEQRGDVGLVRDEPPDVDIGVGQFGGQPDVRLAEDVFDVDAVVGDLLHAHADGHERAAEFTLRIADGDVVRFDIFQIVLLVDASCGEQPDKEQKRQFFHRRSMMGGW